MLQCCVDLRCGYSRVIPALSCVVPLTIVQSARIRPGRDFMKLSTFIVYVMKIIDQLNAGSA